MRKKVMGREVQSWNGKESKNLRILEKETKHINMEIIFKKHQEKYFGFCSRNTIILGSIV